MNIYIFTVLLSQLYLATYSFSTRSSLSCAKRNVKPHEVKEKHVFVHSRWRPILGNSFVDNHPADSAIDVILSHKSVDFSSVASDDFINDNSQAECNEGSYTNMFLSSIDKSRTAMLRQISSWGPKIMLAFVAALYGTNFGCVKLLGEHLDSSVASCLRFSVASLVFAPSALNSIFSEAKRGVVLAGLEVGFYCFLGYLSQAMALRTADASTAAFVCSLTVVTVPLISILSNMFRQNEWRAAPSSQDFTAFGPALMAAAGAAVLELGGSALPREGDLLSFLQPLFFGLYYLRSEAHLRTYTEPEAAESITSVSMLLIAALSWVWAFIQYALPLWQLGGMEAMAVGVAGQWSALADGRVLLALLWTGVVTTAFASYIGNLAMAHISAAESTIIYSTEPLWGTLFAVVALGEEVGLDTGVGAVLILLSCVWSGVGSTLSLTGLSSHVSALVTILESAKDQYSFSILEYEFEKLADNVKSILGRF